MIRSYAPISVFLGIVITMYFDDHAPPHFHARYSGQEAAIGIDPPTLLAGALPARVVGQVFERAHDPPGRTAG
jgi:hypothetical protein